MSHNEFQYLVVGLLSMNAANTSKGIVSSLLFTVAGVYALLKANGW